MGLDVYLYEKAQHEQNEQYNREWEALWQQKDSGQITDAEYDERRKTMTSYASSADVASAINPKHLFNRRYLRSSYNDGGFNHAVPDLIGSAGQDAYPSERGSLYWIFEPLGRDWEGEGAGTLTSDDIPALKECAARAREVARLLDGSDRLRVMTVSPNQFSGPDFLKLDDSAALAKYREQVADGCIKDDGWWSNRDMEVYGSGVSILAAMPGGTRAFFGDQPWPCVHLVYRMSDEGFVSYLQSALITAEFCEEAIALVERDQAAYMSWSG